MIRLPSSSTFWIVNSPVVGFLRFSTGLSQIRFDLVGDNGLVEVIATGKSVYIPEFGAAIDKGKGLIVPGISQLEELLKVRRCWSHPERKSR